MTQEEKAKAYDEALEKAREALSDGTITNNTIAYLQDIFPELKERGDEKIKKCIRMCLTDANEQRFKDYDTNLKDCLAWLEKQGEQKPADEVEPKFEIGDLITNGILVGKVDEIHEWGCHAYFGDYYADVPDVENWHKWTIEDAKDGDVLFTSSSASHETFIFKNIDEKGNAKCYFSYDSEDGFREGKYHFIGRATNCKPATKKQRDTLMKAMANAGYEFDFEKKELKKIDNEIEIPFGAKDSKLQEATYYIPKGFHAEINDDKVVIKKGENPNAWSEEDEERIKNILSVLDVQVCWDGATGKKGNPYQKEINWLKSLKDRVQPEQEWNKVDEKYISSIIKMVEHCGFSSIGGITKVAAIAWLKECVKPKQEWSEKDEKEVAVLEAYIRSKDWSERHIDRALGIVDELVNKVKSLRPQKH